MAKRRKKGTFPVPRRIVTAHLIRALRLDPRAEKQPKPSETNLDYVEFVRAKRFVIGQGRTPSPNGVHSGAHGLGAHRIFITRSQTITGHRRHVRGARHWNTVARPISTRRTPGHLGRYGE